MTLVLPIVASAKNIALTIPQKRIATIPDRPSPSASMYLFRQPSKTSSDIIPVPSGQLLKPSRKNQHSSSMRGIISKCSNFLNMGREQT